MNKTAITFALAALAACSQGEPAQQAENAEPAPAATQAEAWPLEPGTYQYARSDGTSGVNTINADGTFTNAPTGGREESGTWTQNGDLSCIKPSEGFERCYRFTAPDAEGNFTGEMPNGVTVNVRKVG